MEQLRARLVRNARMQEGDPPTEDPAVLLADLDRVLAELRDLIQRINHTNAVTELEAGQTVIVKLPRFMINF